eukprot:1191017-Prorocentrum_minimum.AAC.6
MLLVYDLTVAISRKSWQSWRQCSGRDTRRTFCSQLGKGYNGAALCAAVCPRAVLENEHMCHET